MADILSEIIEKRKQDLQKFGATFGVSIPEKRLRPVNPFLARSGTILEVKRASPSKGDIALSLDPVKTAKAYRDAGTQAISVLTESRFFKGSLQDLIDASTAIQDCSFLRKDFILEESEIEISYRAGADAVLLIARILETPLLLRLSAQVRELNMTPFIEIRSEKDLEKLQLAAKEGLVVGGVNARDLASFRIDPLIPAARRDFMPCKAIFESGALTPQAAAFARELGFEGILIGEAAAKNPETAKNLVSGFMNAEPNSNGVFWKQIARKKEALKKQNMPRPLVKICGITNLEDAELAFRLGADLLGFVFADSPRKTTTEFVKSVYRKFSKNTSSPLLIGVITNPLSPEGKEAIDLAKKGILDAVQFHGTQVPKNSDLNYGRYSVCKIRSQEDISTLRELISSGEPRVMIDSGTETLAGGSGILIQEELIQKIKKEAPLWLAGGISPENVYEIIQKQKPELIDLSSKIEKSPGKKDPYKMNQLFEQIFNRSSL